jgi:amino acid transporter
MQRSIRRIVLENTAALIAGNAFLCSFMMFERSDIDAVKLTAAMILFWSSFMPTITLMECRRSWLGEPRNDALDALSPGAAILAIVAALYFFVP